MEVRSRQSVLDKGLMQGEVGEVAKCAVDATKDRWLRYQCEANGSLQRLWPTKSTRVSQETTTKKVGQRVPAP